MLIDCNLQQANSKYKQIFRMRNTNKQSPLVSDRPFQRSIINQLPESIDLTQKLKQQQLQIQRLRHALQFYKNNQIGNSVQTNKEFQQYIYDIQIKQLIQKAALLQKYRKQNYEFKQYVKELEEQNIYLKSNQAKGTDIQKQYSFALSEINRLKYQNNQIQNQITKLTFQNIQLKKAINSLTQLTQEQYSTSQLGNHSKSINYSDQQNNKKIFSLQSKIKQLQNQVLVKQNKLIETNQNNNALQKRISQLILQKAQYLQQQFFKSDVHKNSRKSVLNSFSDKKQNNSFSKHNNSISEFEIIDYDRLQLKMAQKNKEYEQLWSKYRLLQSDKFTLQQLNVQLQKERKFLADRLSDLEIITEGDSVEGQLQNKLVLMSTQLMRLGTLNRTKTQQNKEFNLKLKEAQFNKESLQKQLLEKQRILLNYKQQLTMMQLKLQSKDFYSQQQNLAINQLKDTLYAMQKEKQRFRYLFRQKQEDFKTVELKCKVYEEKLVRIQAQNKELQKQNRQYQKNVMTQSSNKLFNMELEIDKYKNYNHRLEEQINILQQKLVRTRSQLHSSKLQNQSITNENHNLQNKINSLKQTLRKIQMKSEDQENEIKALKHRYQEKLIQKTEEIRKLQQKIITVQNKSPINSASKLDNTIIQNLHKADEQNMIIKIQIKNYQEKVAMLSQQVERLNFLLDKVNRQVQQLESHKRLISDKDKEIKQYKRKIQNLKNTQTRNQQQLANYVFRLKELSEQLKTYKKFQGQSRRFGHQVQVLKNQLEIKCQELQKIKSRSNIPLSPRSMESDLQAKVSSYQRRLQNLSLQFQEKYKSQISSYTQKIKQYEEKILTFESEVEENQQLTDKLSSQIIRLNQVLGDRIQDIVRLQKQLELAHYKVQKCQQMLLKRENQSKIIIQSTSQIQHSTHNIKQNQKEIALLKDRLESYKISNSQLQAKLDNLTSEKIKLQHKLSEVQYLNGQKSRVNRQKEGIFQLTVSQIKISNQRLQTSIKQLQSYYVDRLQQKDKQLEDVYKQSRQYQNKMHDLEIKFKVQHMKLLQQISFYQNNSQFQKKQSILQKSENQYSKKIREQYQIKLALISQQVERYENLMKQKKQQLKQLRSKLSKQEENNNKMVIDHQCNSNTIQLLSGQIERLSGVLANNFDEIRKLQKDNYKKQLQIQQLKQHIKPDLQYKREEQKKVIQQKQRKIKQEFQEKTHQLQIIVNRHNALEKQNYEQKYQLNDKQIKIAALQSQMAILKQQVSRIKQQKDLIQQKFNQIRQNFMTENQNANNYKAIYQEIKTLRQSNHTLQSKLVLILQQNKQLVHQVQSFKRSKSNSNSNGNSYAISKQMQMPLIKTNQQKYEEMIATLKEENQILTRQKQKLHKQIVRLEDQVLNINKLKQNIRQQKQKTEQFQIKCKKLSNDKKDLTDQIKNLQEDLNKKREQCKNMNKKLNEIQYQNSLHVNKINILTKQVQRLSQKSVRSPLQEEENNKYLSQNLKYKQQLIKYRNQIFILREELQKKKIIVTKLQKIVKENERPISPKLSKDYFPNDKKENLSTIKQVNQIEQRSRTPSVQNNVSINQFEQLSKKYQLLDGLNKKLKNQCDCYRKKNIEYQFKLNKLKEEFELVSKLIQQYRTENQKLKNIARKNINSPVKDREMYKISSKQKNVSNYNQRNGLNDWNNQQTKNYYQVTKQQNKSIVSQNINRSKLQYQENYIDQNMRHNIFVNNHNNVNSNENNPNQNGNLIQHIPMLMNEIDRLSQQNKKYLQQINDLKIQILNFDSRSIRYQQNLAIMVLLMVEVQNLRVRLKATDIQKQKIRKDIVSPIRNNRN